MSYQAVCNHISGDGEGTYEMSQGRLAQFTRLDINRGICQGLVINWLKSIKEWKDYWAEEKKVSEEKGLLSDHKKIQTGKVAQLIYESENESRSKMDNGTLSQLKESGLAFKEGESLKSPNQGFADDRYSIAEQVLATNSRYFLLSIGGTQIKKKKNELIGKKVNIGHAIGIYRSFALFGKSDIVYVFDPNVGEFKVTGKKGIVKVLNGLNSIVYSRSENKTLNLNYYLWSFS